MPRKPVYVIPGGWAQEQEDRQFLATASTQPPMKAGDDPDGWKNVKTLDPANWTIVENQKSQGACQGHDLSTCQESSIVRDGHELIQLSRGGAYYETQRIDGIRGDRGSTIGGGIKLVMETGLVTEADWPYPPRYDPTRPRGYESMPKYKARGFEKLTSYEDVWRFLVMFGSVSIGITWTRDIDNQVARNDGLLMTYGGSGGGGHALALNGLTEVDFFGTTLPNYDGRPWIKGPNSWDDDWGFEGWWAISPRAIDQMLNARWSEFIGIYGAIMPDVGGSPDDDWEPIEA